MQERRIERARFSIYRPPAAPAGIGHEHVHPAPFCGDAAHHRLDCLMIADIDFDAQRNAARSLDLRDRALGGHVLRLGVELPVRLQIEVGDCDFCTEAGQALSIGAA